MLQVGKGRLYCRQEGDAVKFGQLRVLESQLLQRRNDRQGVLHEVFNAGAQVDCLNSESS